MLLSKRRKTSISGFYRISKPEHPLNDANQIWFLFKNFINHISLWPSSTEQINGVKLNVCVQFHK